MNFKMKENGFVSQLGYGELHISSDESYGFRPFQLLVASIAVCSGGVLKKVLEKKRYSVSDINVQTEVTRDADQANKITGIHLHFIVKADGVTDETLGKALELSKKNCPMAQSVIGSINITESYELNN